MATAQGCSAVFDEIKSFEDKLRGLPPAEQKKLIDEQHDNLMSLVKRMVRQIAVIGPVLAFVTDKLMQWLGFDPFTWLHFTEYGDHNASFANKAFSNPNLYEALNQAGRLMLAKKSEHIQSSANHFERDVTSTADADELAAAIIAFCGILKTIAFDDPIKLDLNDVKLLLGTSIKAVMEKDTAKANMNETFFTPFIRAKCVGWVHYNFSSTMSIEKSCCSKKKTFSCDVQKSFFVFSNEAGFRAAVRTMEGC